MREKKFSRSCPVCQSEIKHTTKGSCVRADKLQKLCCSCAKKAIWAREDSPLRSEETRRKRIEGVSKARQDPNCAWNDPEVRKRASETHKRLRADPSGSYQSESYRQNMSIAINAAYARPDNKRRSKEVIDKIRESTLKTWTPEKRKEHSSKMTALWDQNHSHPWMHSRPNGCISHLEMSLTGTLLTFGFKHSSEHRTRIAGFTPDFLNESKKRIIEIFGDFWHHNPRDPRFGEHDWVNPYTKLSSEEKWKQDALRIDAYCNAGYQTMIIWESDLKQGIEALTGSFF